jgi:hypothetical protein
VTSFDSILDVAWPADTPAWAALLACGGVLVSPLIARFAPRLSLRSWVVAWAALSVLLSAAYVQVYLHGGPRIIDATSYWLEARGFASGLVTWLVDEPTAAVRGRFLLHQITPEGLRVGVIFPPGYPALLAVGFLARAPMLVGPLLAGVLTVLSCLLAHALTQRQDVVRIVAVLSALNACLRYHTADTMSHGLAAVLLTGAVVVALHAATHRWGWWLLCGVLSGWLAATRPATALALVVVGLPAVLWWMVSRRRLSPLWIIAGMGPVLLLLVLHQHALTGAWLATAQGRYYLLADGPPGCFRYGFGPGIGCLAEHGPYVASVAPDGFGARAAWATTGRRLYLHLADLLNYAPFAVFLPWGIVEGRRSRAMLFAVAVPLALVIAYSPFYFDGSYPGGGARLLVDAMAFEHVLVAFGLASWARRFRDPVREATDRESNLWTLLCEWRGGLPPMRWVARARAPSPEAGEGWDGGRSRDSKGIVDRVARAMPPNPGESWTLAVTAALCLLGFAMHGSHMHASLRDRDGGQPMFEPSRVQATLGKDPHGLLFVDTDHGFLLAHDPASRDPARSLVVARARYDARDFLRWDKLGRPPAFRYVVDPWAVPPIAPRVQPWSPPDPQGVYVFEAEAEWPPLAQSGGYAAPTHLAADGCVSRGRALSLERTGDEVCVTTEVPSPSPGTYVVQGFFVSNELPSLRTWVRAGSERVMLPSHDGTLEEWPERQVSPDARSCLPTGRVTMRVGAGPVVWEACARGGWVAMDRMELRTVGAL